MDNKQWQQLGDYIKRTRVERELSLRGLAEAAGMSPGGLSEIEGGARLPQPETLQRLAEGLGIEFEDLYALAGYGKPTELPSFVPYLRSKYGGELPPAALAELERYFKEAQRGGKAGES